MVYIDFDGTRFGTNKLNASIRAFTGTRPIAALSSSPLEFRNDKDELKARLIERGAKIESLAGSHFRAYEGMGWRHGQYGSKDKYSIKGRIVIDTYGWNRFNPNTAVFVTPLHAKDELAGSSSSNPDNDSDVEYDPDGDMDEGMPIDGIATSHAYVYA